LPRNRGIARLIERRPQAGAAHSLGWACETVTLLAKPFSEKVALVVLDYLKKRSWSNDTVNKLMA
jgi:ABC-type proline/glycine betaine transport system substrate-binding protein